MLFFNYNILFALLLPIALAAPLPYVVLPHTSATTVSATPASTSLIPTATLPALASLLDTHKYGPYSFYDWLCLRLHSVATPLANRDWHWYGNGNMQFGSSPDWEDMAEHGRKVRDDSALTAQPSAEGQAAMAAEAQLDAAQVAQTEGQIVMDNPAIAQAAAAVQTREASAKPKPTARQPVFGVQSLPRA